MQPALRSLQLLLPALALAASIPAAQDSAAPAPDRVRAAALEQVRATALAAAPASPSGPRAAGPIAERALAGAESSFGLGRIEGRLLGVGPSFRVAFERAGFRFEPRLGPERPVLAFELETVRRGDHVLVDTASLRAAPRQEGIFAVYDLAPGMAERYEVRRDGIEQTFRFETLPPGRGDLIVRGSIATSLHALPGAAGPEGLCFEHDGPGALRYGGVLGIDAAGVTAPGELRFDGRHLELVLPAEFVDRAVPPLVLDPVIGVVDLPVDLDDDAHPGDPDVAYDESTGRYLVVWRRDTFVPPYYRDAEIYGRFFDRLGSPIGWMFPIDIGSKAAYSPRVANVNATDRFLVVYDDTTAIVARSVHAASGSVSARTVVATSPLGLPEIDVGGEPLPPFQNALVAWTEGERWVQYRMVGVPNSGKPTLGGGPIDLHEASDGCGAIAVTNTGGPAGRWLVVWERMYGTAPFGDTDLFGSVIDYTGKVQAPPTNIVTSVGPYERSPSCAGDGTDFVVAFHRKDHDAGAVEVLAQPFALSGTSLVPEGAEIGLEDPGEVGTNPIVDRAGDRYVAVWQRAGYHPKLVGRSLELETCVPCEPAYTVSLEPNSYASDTRIFAQASATTASDVADEAMVVHHPFVGTAPWEIFLTVLEAVGTGGTVVKAGGGCGQGGTIAASGTVAAGHDVVVTVAGLPSSATLAVLNVGPAGPGIPCGSCVIAPAGTIHPELVLFGQASHVLSFPCDPALAGTVVRLQWSVYGAASDCSSGLAYSDMLDLTIGT